MKRWTARLGAAPRVVWAGGAVIAAIVALACYDMVRSYRATVEATGRELDSQAQVLAEQTARSVQAIDVVLRHLQQQIRQGSIDVREPEALHAFLKEQAVGLMQADGLMVVDHDARILAMSRVPPAQLGTVSVERDGPLASLAAASDNRLLIGPPLRSKVTGRWLVPMGRRIEYAPGRFAGAVAAPARVDYFQQFYRDAYPDTGTRVALLHTDTTLLARHPPADETLGRKFALPGELMAASRAGRTLSRNISPLDGADRFGAVREVPDYPLAIVVTRDAALALAPWREQAVGSALRTLALGALAGLLIAVVLRQIGRLDAARRLLVVQQERYALAAAGSDDGIWDWDLVAGVGYESRRARELQGLPLEPETQPLGDLQALFTVHPEDAERRAAGIQAHLDGHTPAYETEYRVRRSVERGDAGYRWIRVRALCIRSADGKPVRIAGSVTDVDERKRAEVALRESEQRFAVAVAGSDDGIWEWDFATGRAFASARARELLGLPPGPELQPMEAWQHEIDGQIHADDKARRQQAIDDHLAGRAPAYAVEFRVRHADGSWRWISVHGMCMRDADGTPRRMAGSASDIDARKRIEQGLRASEERFALAVAGSNDGIIDWDIAADRLYASRRAREIGGITDDREVYTAAEYVALLQLHPDDKERHDADFRRMLRSETGMREHDYRMRQPDGTWRWVRVRGRAVRGSAGRWQRWAGSISDIDAHKRTEVALRRSEERYALAMTGSNEGHWLWDIVERQVYMSAKLAELMGMEGGARVVPDDTYFASLPLHPDDRERVHFNRAEHVAGRTERLDHEFRIVLPATGEERWFHTRAQCFRAPDGTPLRLAGSTVDATRRKRAEVALRESEERYALAMTGSRGGHWVWDAETDGLFVSETVNELFGLPPGVKLETRSELHRLVRLHPEDRARVDTLGTDLLAGRVPRADYEYRVVLPDGSLRWVLTRAQRFAGTENRGARIAGVSVDISERKRAEAERERLQAELRQAQKLEAIGTLAGGIAHDFNNILSAILGYGELAQRDAPPGTPLRRHVDAALAAGARAKSLVERILAFSRSGMGERVPVHVATVVAEALDAVYASLPPGVTLERRIDSGDAGVTGDATQIHQVVLNLAANAVQSMKAGGPLAVALDPVVLDAALPVTTRTLAPGAYLRLVVRDAGTGIEPRVLERIFDPFFTTKEVGVGTGLGLSLVHGIVTDLGGGIAVESRVGAGSTFSVWLPSCGVVAAPAAVDEAPVTGNGETILIVDDEEALVRLGEEALAELGYEPVGYTSPAAALAALRAEPGRFDALLTDESMPGMTGSELAAEALALRPDLPVVIASGFVTPALRERARVLGVREVLAKPLSVREVACCLADVLRREHLHGAAA